MLENLLISRQSGICVNIRHTDQWNKGESRNVLNIYIHKEKKRTLTFYFTPNTNTNSKPIIMPTAKKLKLKLKEHLEENFLDIKVGPDFLHWEQKV